MARLLTLAERPKLSVSRTSNPRHLPNGGGGLGLRSLMRAGVFAACVGAAALSATAGGAYAQYSPAGARTPASATTAKSSAGIKFATPDAAYEHGRSALQSGHPELAIAAFEYAAERGVFLAQFYLARVFADNTLSLTDHARAFELYQSIVTEFAEVDVDDNPRAPFVAKSMIALADYFRSGIPSAGVQPDLEQTAKLLRSAAKAFRDEDAQYELAKLLLHGGDGVAADPQEAVYWLRRLSQHGHTSAQAILADLYWRGQHVQKDKTQALLLITLAAENAPATERVWIEDKYQNIFCGAGEGVRRQTQGAVAEWRSKYGRAREERPGRDGLSVMQPHPQRTCSNGELVLTGRRSESARGPIVETSPVPRLDAVQPRSEPGTGGYAAAPMPGSNIGSGAGFMQGNVSGFSLRDSTQKSLTPPR